MSNTEDAIPPLVDDVDTQPVASRQILIVDDIPANLIAMEAALEPLRRRIVKAGSGRQALSQLLEHDFSLLILDVHMPDMDGFETAGLIRARARTRHLPIIFVTAHQQTKAAELRAYELGAVDFLFKPIEPAILIAKASVFIRLQDRTEELATERLQREFDTIKSEYETQALQHRMEQEQAAKEELARLNEALAENDRRKDSFLAILGHELRNPLAPIRSAIDLIKSSRDRAALPRIIDVLDRQTSVLTRLVDDLLDVARINANKIELRPDRCDLRVVVDTAISASRPMIEERDHLMRLVSPSTSVRVVVDQVRMVQVITNLLNNAARYTAPRGRIDVVIGTEGDRAFVRVIDTGIGIPAELLPRIFEMFVQERARSDGSGGLGLGLSLARQLVEMHRGTIQATSPGRDAGSTFEIRVPLDGTRDALMPRVRSDMLVPLARPATTSLRTVVIDDNADARTLLAELLTSHGHVVITAEDGQRGLEMIRDHRPDVALVDLGLPDLDGLALARTLRETCPDLRTRLVALTGYGHLADLERTKDAGFHAHLVKPATLAEILEALAPGIDGA